MRNCHAWAQGNAMDDKPQSPRPTDAAAAQPPTVDQSVAADPALQDATLQESDPGPRTPDTLSGDSALPMRAIGDFELLEEIGRGSMGVVYRARERHSGRLVALKMMLDPPGREGGNRRRFALEARATGQLSHPGIVTIHAWGERDGHPFYTMDYVPGTLLSRILEDGPLPCDRAARYLIAAARAVAAAHALGIVHRDLKPGNIIIDADDQPRVLDFGLAKRLSLSAPGSTPPSLDSIAGVLPSDLASGPAHAKINPASSGESRATEQGAILGTPTYMAPEQAVGDHRNVGPATDVHALGAIFYEMLTGRPPFQAATILEVMKKVAERDPTPLRSWGLRVPPALEAVCVRALHKKPQDRYANAGALAADLEYRWQRCLLGPRYARLTGWATLVFALLAGVWLAMHGLDFAPRALDFAAELPAVSVLLLELALFFGAGLLAFGAALSWLGAWARHAERPAWIIAKIAASAATAWGAWLLAPDGTVPAALILGIASLLSLAAAVAAGGWYVRRLEEIARKMESDASASRPFMQRLMAATAHARRAIEAREDQVASVASPVQVGLGDFELARVLHRWGHGRVQRGRQKSLDRPVLIWMETGAAPDEQPQQGVLVRHPSLLGLYAVGTGPEGSFLVTEPSQATPLADLLERSPLTPLQAARLAARLARVIEAYHELGACHGRLSMDWVLIRAELEPVLCPCGAPCRSDQDRAGDIHALGELLLDLLSERRGRAAQDLRQIGKAARRGDYARAVDLATDLDQAARAIGSRWRGHVLKALILVFATLPWLMLPAFGVELAFYLPIALAPSCALLGYTQARTLVARHRLRRRLLKTSDLLKGLAPLLLLTVPAGLLAASGWTSLPGDAFASMLITADLLGCWLAGTLLASLITTAEAIYATLMLGRTAATPLDRVKD